MKTTTTLLLALLFSALLKAQTIQQLSILPANPTTGDTIRVVADLMFFSGGCDLQQANTVIVGNNISVDAMHCPGLLTVICNTKDTINLGVLPSGNYALDFNVLTGIYDMNIGGCTSYQPGGTQTLSFAVTVTNNIQLPETGTLAVNYDRQRDALMLSGKFSTATLRIMDLTGKILYRGNVTPGEVPFNSLPAQGLLIYRLQLPNGTEKAGRVLVER